MTLFLVLLKKQNKTTATFKTTTVVLESSLSWHKTNPIAEIGSDVSSE